MQSTAHAFKDNARRAVADPQLRRALNHVKEGFIVKRRKAADRMPEFERLRDQARDIKNHTLANLAFYLERYEAKVTAARASSAVAHQCTVPPASVTLAS